MQAIHSSAYAAAADYGMACNYVAGANIAAFVQVADAMLEQGLVSSGKSGKVGPKSNFVPTGVGSLTHYLCAFRYARAVQRVEYKLDPNGWEGGFGSVMFRLHGAIYNGEMAYHIRTDASDPAVAACRQRWRRSQLRFS